MAQVIRVPRDVQRAPVEGFDFNQDGRVTPGELAGSALLLTVGLFLLLSVIACSVAVLVGTRFADFLKFAPKLLAGFACFCALIGAGLLAWRLIVYEKQERVEKRERDRRYRVEDYEFDLIRGVVTQEEDTRWNDAVQSRFARLWLNLSYERGSAITRDEWKAQGLPADAWNRINDLMKRRKIRDGRRSDLLYDSLLEAWGAWCDAEIQSRAWVKSGGEMLRN